jgi:hypothetical protein
MKITIKQDNSTSVVKQQDASKINVGVREHIGAQGLQGPRGEPGLSLITTALDVDATHLDEGDVLVFNKTANKWVAQAILEEQYIEGGHF